jgi:hypothetical protein
MPRRRDDVPASGSSSPAISRSIVDLPEPFAPIDADAGARLDREVEPVEHGSAAERLADGVQADEATALAAANDREHVLVLAVAQRSRRGGRRPRSRCAASTS